MASTLVESKSPAEIAYEERILKQANQAEENIALLGEAWETLHGEGAELGALKSLNSQLLEAVGRTPHNQQRRQLMDTIRVVQIAIGNKSR